MNSPKLPIGEGALLQTTMERLPSAILEILVSPKTIVLSAVVVVLVGVLSYRRLPKSSAQTGSRKSQQAKAMMDAYKNIGNELDLIEKNASTNNDISLDTMTISQLWIYPIKSMRGCQVPSAMLTREGFYLDRRFMILKDHCETPRKLENMSIGHFSSMCLFHQSISGNILTISFGTTPSDDSIKLPLEPDHKALEKIPIDMYGSPTIGYNMGDKYNEWLSERFGFKVILAYWGGNPRAVLGNLPGRPSNQGPTPKNAITKIFASLPVVRSLLQDDETIAFNDCAPYLVISETSVADVNSRLPDDVDMDLTKFRANVVLKGSDTPYTEDFWAELTFASDSNQPKIILTGNCGRCASLNVDYHTGKSGTGKDGQVLKLLQKDRRVDLGAKYSPIFGRYGFVGKGGEGAVLHVGDEVVVSRRNEERTKFYWPELST